MRALILARSKTPVPMELAPMMAQGFRDWRQQHRERLQEFAWFTTGTGGCAIANVANETELFQMMVSWPLTPFSDIDVYTLVDGDEALDFWANMLESMTGAQPV